MCGEKGLPVSVAPRYQGSPPRVRGKVSLSGTKSSSTRITPACAGKSQIQRGVLYTAEDHPRVCGEKTLRIDVFDASVGSPPRVRGKVHRVSVFVHDHGITPACAGKSIASPFSFTLLQDHPRVCGEKPFLAAELALMTGSPPRVRGKAFMKRYFSSYGGITPACAGKSHTLRFRIPRHRDHPRVCGEKE